MRVHYASPVAGLSAIRSETFQQLFGEYEKKLLGAGYHHKAVRLQLQSVAHFGVWCEREDRRLETINDQTLEVFERHRSTCRCPGTSRNRTRQVCSCVRGFLRYLRERGVTPVEARAQPVRWVQGFLRWMRVDRGVVESTLTSYGSYVGDLVRVLGDDPRAYTARGLRDFVEQRCRHYRRNSSRMVVAAVRMFVRYLAVEGQCRPGLEHALTSPANWSHQSLPRGLSPEEVGRVLAGCPSTPRGLRDRAVLLLLIRLGLRAGDVKRLRFADLCFDTAAIRVSGKGGRAVRLPLPQDVGDALLEYLRAGRPSVDSEFVFLRSTAPFDPFALRPAGKAVGHLARAALKRAAVHPPTRGAHVFRHTAACQLLRQGVSLEGIAEVLRQPLRRNDGHLRQGGRGAARDRRPTLAGGGAMLSAAVDTYLTRRRAAGFQLNDHEGILRDFARFASAAGDAVVRTRTVLDWVRARDGSPHRRCVRLRTVVHFARYLQAEDARHEVPPQDVFGRHPPRRRPPFLFVPHEVRALVGAARALDPRGARVPLVYPTLFGLLASTGLRISEALNMQRQDVTAEGLVVRHTKFGKSRLLPLHSTTRRALDQYLERRDQETDTGEYVFLSRRGRKLAATTVRGVFGRLLRSLGIASGHGQSRPRLHDLRFYFANQALTNGPADDTGISRHMVALTTYLGHRDVRNSYWYLEATPVLLARIAERCEDFVNGGHP